MSYWNTIIFRKPKSEEYSILWNSSIYFFGMGFLGLCILVFIDQTEINGEPRWLKPLKFFISIVLYNLTLEWIYRVYQNSKNLSKLNVARAIISTGMVLEASLIFIQAARGVESHFNTSTLLDTAIFNLMGISISVVVVAALHSGYVIWQSREMATPAFNESIVYGFLIMTFASFQGFVMTEPTPEQLAAVSQGAQLSITGSSFVGQLPQDNHRIIPFLGWSLDVGDMRISHFIGLHALHFFLILMFLLHRFNVASPLKVTRFAAIAYFCLFAYAFWRAQFGLFLF